MNGNSNSVPLIIGVHRQRLPALHLIPAMPRFLRETNAALLARPGIITGQYIST